MNHCYGGRYKAGLVDKAEDWSYLSGSLLDVNANMGISMSCHLFEKALVMYEENLLSWLNTDYFDDDYKKLQRAACKTEFKFSRSNTYSPKRV